MSSLEDGVDFSPDDTIPDLMGRFETPDPEVDFVVTDPDELEPEVHALSKTEYDALIKRAEGAGAGNEAVAKGFEGLSAALQQQAAVSAETLKALNRPTDKAEISEEALYKQFADDVLDPEKAPAALKRIIEHVRGQERNSLSTLNAATYDRLSELTLQQVLLEDDEIVRAAKPYKAEVTEILKRLSPVDRSKPENIRMTMNQVVATHLTDILKAEREKTSKGQVESPSQRGQTTPTRSPTGVRPTTGSPSTGPKMTVNLNDPNLIAMAQANWATSEAEIKAFALSELRRNGGKPTWLKK